jgi:hypothetical protein
MEPQTL